MSKATWYPKKKAWAKKLFERGWSAYRVSRKLGLRLSTIRRLRNSLKPAKFRNSYDLPSGVVKPLNHEERARECFERGWSAYRISQELGLGYITVRRWRIAWGFAPKPAGRPPLSPKLSDKLRRLAGKRSDVKVAAELGVSYDLVRNYRRRNGTSPAHDRLSNLNTTDFPCPLETTGGKKSACRA